MFGQMKNISILICFNKKPFFSVPSTLYQFHIADRTNAPFFPSLSSKLGQSKQLSTWRPPALVFFALAVLPPPLLQIQGPPFFPRVIEPGAQLAEPAQVLDWVIARLVEISPPEVGEILHWVLVQKMKVLCQCSRRLIVIHIDVRVWWGNFGPLRPVGGELWKSFVSKHYHQVHDLPSHYYGHNHPQPGKYLLCHIVLANGVLKGQVELVAMKDMPILFTPDGFYVTNITIPQCCSSILFIKKCLHTPIYKIYKHIFVKKEVQCFLKNSLSSTRTIYPDLNVILQLKGICMPTGSAIF